MDGTRESERSGHGEARTEVQHQKKEEMNREAQELAEWNERSAGL